jgi:hypothetical protein
MNHWALIPAVSCAYTLTKTVKIGRLKRKKKFGGFVARRSFAVVAITRTPSTRKSVTARFSFYRVTVDGTTFHDWPAVLREPEVCAE